MSDPLARPTTLYLGGNRAITKTRYGARIFFDTRDLSVGIPLALDGDYEPDLNPWMIGMLRPGDVAVDVGANIGFYTIHFAARVGASGHVHAFECNPDVAALLRDSIEINYLKERCTLHSFAISDSIGEVTFHQPVKHQGGGSLVEINLANDTWTPITVSATTLDAVFSGSEPPVRLLHIDTEFSEPNVIAGGHSFIERHRDMIVVLEVLGEASRNRGDDSLRAALEYLMGTGRALCVIQNNKPIEISIAQLLEYPLANAAAIPRHLAGA
ncbi:MAG: FkbM family methyltransferase [Vulcanimicrobiaceae bacterium]